MRGSYKTAPGRPLSTTGHGPLHQATREMNELLGLAGFAFVGSITPGPNNSLLWASGLRFGFRRTAFQFANPQAWLFALAAVGTFLPPSLAPVVAALAVAATSAVVILGTAAVWAAAGAALNRIADNARAQRAISVTLALLLAASVAFIWI